MPLFAPRRRRFLDPPRFDADDPGTTVIAAGARLEGDIRSAGGAVIAGRLDGDLKAGGAVLVVATGSIGGSVACSAAKIEGLVEGSLEASGRVELDGTGRVGGSVRAARLDCARGVILGGPVEVGEGPLTFTERRARPR